MFDDRDDAGRRLGRHLTARGGPLAAAGMRPGAGPGTVVLGLPRGGVPVAARVAEALGVALDVVCVRKLGVPGQPEYAMGALGEDGVRVVSEIVLREAHVDPAALAAVERAEAALLAARVRRLRAERPRLDLSGRTAVLVDDGVATGATARAACAVVRALGAGYVLLATPAAPVGLAERLPEADAVVALRSPRPFGAVGRHYRDFSPVSEETVLAELAAADRRDLEW